MYHVCMYHNVATKLQLTYKFSLTSQVSAFFGFRATLTLKLHCNFQGVIITPLVGLI